LEENGTNLKTCRSSGAKTGESFQAVKPNKNEEWLQMKLVIGLGFLALMGFAAISDATSTASHIRGPLVAATQSSSTESLDVWIDSLRRQHNVPAMGAIVFRADTILVRGVAGVRRSNSTEPVKENDRFQLGSNTKAITATVIATLVEEGKLKWTTTLADVFPELRDAMSSEFRDVTIDMLLSHHAGISPSVTLTTRTSRASPASLEHRLSGARHSPPGFYAAKQVVPVRKGVYSNGGYAIAGAAGERITGQSWELLVQTRIFKPLGLTGSFAWSNLRISINPGVTMRLVMGRNLWIRRTQTNGSRQSSGPLVQSNSRWKTTRVSCSSI
jgi:CubicO group peptidase (beta-lactamase class C family)